MYLSTWWLLSLDVWWTKTSDLDLRSQQRGEFVGPKDELKTSPYVLKVSPTKHLISLFLFLIWCSTSGYIWSLSQFVKWARFVVESTDDSMVIPTMATGKQQAWLHTSSCSIRSCNTIGRREHPIGAYTPKFLRKSPLDDSHLVLRPTLLMESIGSVSLAYPCIGIIILMICNYYKNMDAAWH